MTTTTRVLLGVVAVILLLPGVCALGFMAQAAFNWLEGYRNTDYIEIMIVIWIVSLGLGGLGLFILRRVQPRAAS